MQISVPYDNNELVPEHLEWIASQEECVTNEVLADECSNGQIVHIEDVKEKVQMNAIQDDHADVIKVYKIRVSKKPTLKNLKKRKGAQKDDNKCNGGKGNKSKKKFVRNVSKRLKAIRRMRRRKWKNDDLAYKAPAFAKDLLFTGLFKHTYMTEKIAFTS